MTDQVKNHLIPWINKRALFAEFAKGNPDKVDIHHGMLSEVRRETGRDHVNTSPKITFTSKFMTRASANTVFPDAL